MKNHWSPQLYLWLSPFNWWFMIKQNMPHLTYICLQYWVFSIAINFIFCILIYLPNWNCIQCNNDIVMGDFNGRKKPKVLLSKYYILLNTFFKEKFQRKWTFIRPDGRTKNEIDYVPLQLSTHSIQALEIQNFNIHKNWLVHHQNLETPWSLSSIPNITTVKTARLKSNNMTEQTTQKKKEALKRKICHKWISWSKESH